jgi:hypothetical protein
MRNLLQINMPEQFSTHFPRINASRLGKYYKERIAGRSVETIYPLSGIIAVLLWRLSSFRDAAQFAGGVIGYRLMSKVVENDKDDRFGPGVPIVGAAIGYIIGRVVGSAVEQVFGVTAK